SRSLRINRHDPERVVACARRAVMVEVAAEKNDKGRVGDPAAAARRRAMTLKMRQARQTLTTNSFDFTGQYASLARLFANSVASATPVMALVAVAVGVI